MPPSPSLMLFHILSNTTPSPSYDADAAVVDSDSSGDDSGKDFSEVELITSGLLIIVMFGWLGCVLCIVRRVTIDSLRREEEELVLSVEAALGAPSTTTSPSERRRRLQGAAAAVIAVAESFIFVLEHGLWLS
jgi:hypothetical protein